MYPFPKSLIVSTNSISAIHVTLRSQHSIVFREPQVWRGPKLLPTYTFWQPVRPNSHYNCPCSCNSRLHTMGFFALQKSHRSSSKSRVYQPSLSAPLRRKPHSLRAGNVSLIWQQELPPWSSWKGHTFLYQTVCVRSFQSGLVLHRLFGEGHKWSHPILSVKIFNTSVDVDVKSPGDASFPARKQSLL